MKCEEIRVIAASGLLIIRHTAEKRSMFHIYNSITDSGIEFVHKISFSYKFNKFEDHQQLNLIEKALNKDCFEGLIVKVVMLDDNVQEFSIIFLKTAIFLLAGLQFESSFHD